MSTYISLLRYTQHGIESVKESPARLEAARKAFEKLGARIKDFYPRVGDRGDDGRRLGLGGDTGSSAANHFSAEQKPSEIAKGRGLPRF
jgi:hypothetical protein